ncbi:MAG: DUF2946 family protein [Phycisphaerales bacterium]
MRITTWLFIVSLLLHGTGAVSLFHQIAHHQATPVILLDSQHDGCKHAPNPSPNTEDEQAPSHMPLDKDCSICLGLAAGLQLIPATQVHSHVPVPDQRLYVVISEDPVFSTLRDGSHPARAPPLS